jgi:hypothetical protein
MSTGFQPAELGFIGAGHGGQFERAARELGITTSAVSKRLAQMERVSACRWSTAPRAA